LYQVAIAQERLPAYCRMQMCKRRRAALKPSPAVGQRMRARLSSASRNEAMVGVSPPDHRQRRPQRLAGAR
jgi:hypothetical protein